MNLYITYLGHSSFIINMNGINILTDPYFDNKTICNYKRLIDCAVTIDKLPRINCILISHEHFDAFDINSTNLIVKKNSPKIIAHQSILNMIEGSEQLKVPIDEYEKKTVQDICYSAYPAHHPTAFYPLSYVISNKKNSVYFAGDTLMTKEQECIKADVAILPIGGDMTLDAVSAMSITKKIKPKYIIPMHYNTFAGISQDPLWLKERLEKKNCVTKMIILNPGKKWAYR